MNREKRGFFVEASVTAGTILSILLLLHAGPARAMYLTDGTVSTSPGVYDNPSDGFCVSGLKTDGTMTVVPATNFRDCVAYTTGLTGLTATDVTSRSTCPTSGVAPYTKACNVSTNCTKADGSLTWVAALQKCFDTSACTVQGATDGDSAAHACVAPNDGARHAYSASLCINASTRAGISRLDLDNTAANCQEKGGVLADGLFGHPYGACSAYGWIYGGVKSDGTLPDLSGGHGVTSAANLGFCYTSMRMTSVTGVCVGGTAAGTACNSNTPCTGGGQCSAYNLENTGAGCPSWHNSNTKAASEWTAGTDGVKYQSQASYDAGLGWSFSSPNCLYAYGVKGYLNADLRGADGAIPSVALCAGGTGSATAGTCVDLSAIASQGACLAIGATWDNWLPVGTGVAPYATNQTVTTSLGCTGGTNAGLACTVATQVADCPGTGGGVCAASDSTVKKLDATTLIAAGGGKFFSGTGSVCTKCHTDESRAYMERYKPGYVETGHKLAGDTAPFTHVGDAWGLKGVQCEICHATGRPTAQDVGTIIYPTKVCTGGTNNGTACTTSAVCTGGGVCTGGVPRGASGHNQTEYGSHVTGVCFTCHGTAAVPESTSPASVIPVSSGDFALTSKNLAPIANEFLNSPHAKYAGTSNKLDIITKTNYSSSFDGMICRTGSEVTDAATATNGVDVTSLATCGAASNLTCNSATNCPATPGGNRVWNAVTSKCYDMGICTGAAGKTWDSGTNRCVETQTTCQAQSDSGYSFIWSTTGTAGVPSLITTSGAGCYKPFAGGSIVTTYFDGTEAKRIPNLDTATNAFCTNPTTGAAAFWTADGEAAGSTSGVAFPATDQGNCMTCHDVHWSLSSTNPEAEPLRRECTTCHSHPTGEASVTNAPQINLATINHLGGTGTPLANVATNPSSACEKCHMPDSSETGSVMHLWRISTDPSYVTMGTTQANTAADGSYTNAAWVDLDHACGQCHGGGTVEDAQHMHHAPALYRTRAKLALVAAGMHDASGVSYPTTFTIAPSGLTVTTAPIVNCGGSCPTLTYDWNWGEGSDTSTNPGTHTYSTGGSKSITLTVSLASNGKKVGSVTRSTSLTAVNTAPVASSTCAFTASTWGMQVVDTSTDSESNIQTVVVEWGDGARSLGHAL
ncbi:MAG: hypothetical protein HY270_17370, partial [Deltaproteobacteria bacterium]|nr:hypothetical protein [Deltaproteobacteria bacterium]